MYYHMAARSFTQECATVWVRRWVNMTLAILAGAKRILAESENVVWQLVKLIAALATLAWVINSLLSQAP